MDISREGFYRQDALDRLRFTPPAPPSRSVYPVLTILLLSALLWGVILAPVIWLHAR
jgi:hypothetical protein